MYNTLLYSKSTKDKWKVWKAWYSALSDGSYKITTEWGYENGSKQTKDI